MGAYFTYTDFLLEKYFFVFWTSMGSRQNQYCYSFFQIFGTLSLCHFLDSASKPSKDVQTTKNISFVILTICYMTIFYFSFFVYFHHKKYGQKPRNCFNCFPRLSKSIAWPKLDQDKDDHHLNRKHLKNRKKNCGQDLKL